jgi:RND family efflux transporter MFP subunit
MSRFLGKSAALVLGAALVYGFVRSVEPHPATPAQARESESIGVKVAPVTQRDVPIERELFGTLAARAKVALAARLLARVETVAADVGERVAAGALLVALDDADVAAQVARAEAEHVALERLAADAERELARTQELFERGARTTQEVDRATTERDSSVARRDAAARAVEAARATLADTQLFAPFDAVVVARHVEPGDLARPGATLLELAATDDVRVVVAVPEALIAAFDVGAQRRVHVDALAADFTGTVVEVAAELDASTRTRRAEIELAPDATLLPGLFVRVPVAAGSRRATVVPRSALIENGALEHVFVLDAEERRARLVLVRSGARLGDDVELASGANDAAWIVVEAAGRLSDGAAVHVTTRTDSSGSSESSQR